MHLQSVDQNEAIKTVKHTITELDRSKIEEQKKEANITEPRNLEEQAISLVGKDIYEKLQLPGWDAAEPAIRNYIDSKRGYKKNEYEYKPRTIQLVNEHWGQAIDDWGYERRS